MDKYMEYIESKVEDLEQKYDVAYQKKQVTDLSDAAFKVASDKEKDEMYDVIIDVTNLENELDYWQDYLRALKQTMNEFTEGAIE